VNLVLNYLLIFGMFGFPRLGVEGAAIATVISRYVQVLMVILWTHGNREKMSFIQGIYKKWSIPGSLAWKITLKGMPLMINEILWSAGIAMQMQCYSMRGLDTVAALNISSTITNLFNIVFLALGSSISIVVGQMLGAGKKQEAKDTAYKMTFFAVASCVVLSIIMSLGGRFFPYLYNVEPEVHKLASMLIIIAALTMPIHAYMNATYFTLRSGGKTLITFLFDSVFLWGFVVSLAFALFYIGHLSIFIIFPIVQCTDIIKDIIGYIFIKKKVWVVNIVN
jgi:Na+-driven multidrug efflux pump